MPPMGAGGRCRCVTRHPPPPFRPTRTTLVVAPAPRAIRGRWLPACRRSPPAPNVLFSLSRSCTDEARMPDHAFELAFTVRWSDLDANRHLKNTAFVEYAVDTRFQMLESRGYPQARFEEQRFGPVLFREEIRYRREVVAGQTVTVNVVAAGMSSDGSHWIVRHDVRGPDGKEAAVLTVEGAWIHLDTRRLVTPPAELME